MLLLSDIQVSRMMKESMGRSLNGGICSYILCTEGTGFLLEAVKKLLSNTEFSPNYYFCSSCMSSVGEFSSIRPTQLVSAMLSLSLSL